MEEADKDWMIMMMVGGRVFLLVPAHPGSPGQRAITTVNFISHHHQQRCNSTNNIVIRQCILKLLAH